MNPLDILTEKLREWHGPLTQELVKTPGKFGLGLVPEKSEPDEVTKVVCGYCSTGCALNVHLKKNVAVNLSAAVDYPVNLGMACPKGWEALTPLKAPDRATTPLLRDATGKYHEIDWDHAMAEFCGRFKAIQNKYGKNSIAFLSTGQICTEEMLFVGALWKFGIGALHCDANTRQCMATAATAYKESFGFDAPPFTYQDFEESDVLVFVGANPCIAHPIMWQRVMRNPHHPEIIVIDPRVTETAMSATQHYPLKPKSDLTLLYGVANELIKNAWLDQDFIRRNTKDFEAFKEHVKSFTLEPVSKETGLTPTQIGVLTRAIGTGKRVSFWWTMGVNQSHEATRTAQAIINLALMTGNIGRSGTGANSITGQCNAMGSRIFSNTTGLMGGYSFLKAEDRRKVASIIGVPEESVPTENSWAYDEIVEGVRRGEIKGLWVIATNTAHSWINQNDFTALTNKLDFLVVQDMYGTTDTARLADLILPAAGWGEKDGTFINSERRIGLVKKVARAPGVALSDFHIFKLISHYWGCGDFFEKWKTPEDIFQTMKELSRGQPCDITGIRDYKMLDECGGVQWPFPTQSNAPVQERRLFEDGIFFHKNGKAPFIFETPREPAELTDSEYPFILLTGRGSSAQWHTNTRTGKSQVLQFLYPKNPYAEIHPSDGVKLGISDGETVIVRSRRGSMEVKAALIPTVQPGQIFIPMHFAGTNQLTYPSFDPYSRQPSYKHCAVTISAISCRS